MWGRVSKHSPYPSDPGYSIKDRVRGNDDSIQGLGFSSHTGVKIVDLFFALYSRGQIQDLRRECLHPGNCYWVVPGQERVFHHSFTAVHPATLHHDIKLAECE